MDKTKRGEVSESSTRESALRRARLDPQERDWWKRAVLYQVYPRSFRDANGDGVGDLRGLIQKLPEISALGVDAVWVCPFFKSPMRDFGYDITDHQEVDPLFGDLNDAKELIEEAHALGLRILIDLVISHTSDEHAWFKESRQSRASPKSDYYVWADPLPDGSPPNNWLSIFGGSAWRWNTRRRQYYLHNFLVSQPDLNFHHPEVQEGVLALARFWLELGVDGFRLDTVNFYFHDEALRSNPPAEERDCTSAPESNPYGWQDHVYDKNRPEVTAFLERLRALLDEFPGSIALGEIGESPQRSLELLAEYTQPQRLHLCYSFDLLAPEGDAPYWRSVIQSFEEHTAVRGVESWACWAFSNHDVMRATTRLCPQGGDLIATGELILALLLSLRGTPCIYQGEELSLPEAEVPYEYLVDPYGIEFWPDFKGRDGCRTPYPWDESKGVGFTNGSSWLPIDPSHRARSFSAQAVDPQGSLMTARALIQERAKSSALAEGSLALQESAPEILAFERTSQHERVLCLFNPSTQQRSWSAHRSLGEPLIASKGVEVESDHVHLPPQSWLWIRVADPQEP